METVSNCHSFILRRTILEKHKGGSSWLPLASLEEDIGSHVTSRMLSCYVGTPLGWPREGEVFLQALSTTCSRMKRRISHIHSDNVGSDIHELQNFD